MHLTLLSIAVKYTKTYEPPYVNLTNLFRLCCLNTLILGQWCTSISMVSEGGDFIVHYNASISERGYVR